MQRLNPLSFLRPATKLRAAWIFLLFASLLSTQPAHGSAGDPAVVPGVVQPAVKVLADASNSYALYLPKNYTQQKRWPVLLAFDPSGNGVDPVRVFQPAAEKYGFILIGSNNSQNFMDPSAAIRLLWDDFPRRYAVDPRRIYATGFSGGARVASGLANACTSCIAGLVLCGAGLPPEIPAPRPEVADWFLTAGTTDFNYSEILRLADTLDAHHGATHMVFFPGPHSWMPPEVAEQALAWMQLRAMVKGLLPADKEFIAAEYSRRAAAAKALQQSGAAMAAARAYRELLSDFRSLPNVDVKDIEAQAAELAKSKELKKGKKDEQNILEIQDRVTQQIVGIANAMMERDQPAPVLQQQLEAFMVEIRRERDSTHDDAHKDALARGVAGGFAFTRESASKRMLKKDYSTARDLFMATSVIRPGPWSHYLLSQAYALLGNKKAALESLRKSVELGLKDPRLLEDSAFDQMREDAGFKDVLARLTEAANKAAAN
jgi:dienelactone hydrolase